MRTPDVETMVAGYLRAGGYGGLYNEDGCGCGLDDFAPCGEIQGNCQAAWRVPCFRKPDGSGCSNGDCDAYPGATCSTTRQP
jgi:hypothetical protein